MPSGISLGGIKKWECGMLRLEIGNIKRADKKIGGSDH